MTTELTRFSIAEARTKLKAREVSAVELTQAFLRAIEVANPALNAYIAVTADKALRMAAACDERLARGKARPLEGIALGIKDLFCTRDVHSQAASRILDGFRPPYESTVSRNLWLDGAVMLGKLNMDEFAMGSSNETSCYGPAINPWRVKNRDRALVPGGSSGGSAAAVAARLCAGATGSDTGGSIRQPAAFTGTVGVRPTYGRCSRWGMIAFASSLDQAGPIARTVRDAAILLRSMAGYDEKDATSADRPVPDYEAALTGNIKGLKVGVPRQYAKDLSADIEALWQKGIDWLRMEGAEIRDVDLPHADYALPVYYIVAPAEASSNLARYDAVRYGLRVNGDNIAAMYENSRAKGFGAEVKRRILIGTYVLSAGYYEAYYLKAQKVRRLISHDFDTAFGEVDVLLTPSAPNAAFALGEIVDPMTMYRNDIFTVGVSLAGLPGLSVPAGLNDDGLPLGLQLIAKPFAEETVFRAAGVLEAAAGFTVRPESWWTS
ncbi:MAG: Asp-tRNA(Asn)/Glu-tRNA(Gln) amidotransferase subunit GatA [Hyphomicrobiales bacterium]